jgi:hypothetical protein
VFWLYRVLDLLNHGEKYTYVFNSQTTDNSAISEPQQNGSKIKRKRLKINNFKHAFFCAQKE